MVNLVLHHQQEPSLPSERTDAKSPTDGRARNDIPPVSPLTQNESLFGAGLHQTLNTFEERDQPPLVSVPSGNGLEMICDYDRSVIQLYEMLESSQWKNACARCESHPEEVHTWVVRRDANGNTRWKLLPLHAAVIFKAPLNLIEDLLRMHPIAAAKRDDQGILPLHLAFRHKSNEAVIEKLLHQYPGGVIIKDHRGRFPLDHGKDMKFSAKLMGLYAETFTKCQHVETKEDDANRAVITATYEKRIGDLKDAYEARIVALQKNHTQTIETIEMQAKEDLQRNREKHVEEIVGLKSQVARAKIAGKKASELEGQFKGLSKALADSTGELAKLRKVVQEQKEQKEAFADEMIQILNVQRALDDRCNKQQEQLDQAQKLREQLLRTLLQKENGKTIEVSNEICEISKNNLARTEMLINTLSLDPSDRTVHNSHNQIPSNIESYRGSEDLPSDCDNAPTNPSWSAESLGDHGDDISAITDSSYIQPFGDR